MKNWKTRFPLIGASYTVLEVLYSGYTEITKMMFKATKASYKVTKYIAKKAKKNSKWVLSK